MPAENLFQRVFTVLRAFRHSHNATSALKKACGLTVLMPAATRWSTLHITYSRAVEIWEHINSVASELNFGEISRADKRMMEAVCKILEPFRKLTEKVEQRNAATLSLVLPGIYHLIENLRSVDIQKNEFFLKQRYGLRHPCSDYRNAHIHPLLEAALVTQLEARFLDVLTSGQPYADPTWLVAAVLNPEVSAYISPESKELAPAAIRSLVMIIGT